MEIISLTSSSDIRSVLLSTVSTDPRSLAVLLVHPETAFVTRPSSFSDIPVGDLARLSQIQSYSIPTIVAFRALLYSGKIALRRPSDSTEKGDRPLIIVCGLVAGHLAEPARANAKDIFESIVLLADTLALKNGLRVVIIEREEVMRADVPYVPNQYVEETTIRVQQLLRRWLRPA